MSTSYSLSRLDHPCVSVTILVGFGDFDNLAPFGNVDRDLQLAAFPLEGADGFRLASHICRSISPSVLDVYRFVSHGRVYWSFCIVVSGPCDLFHPED